MQYYVMAAENSHMPPENAHKQAAITHSTCVKYLLKFHHKTGCIIMPLMQHTEVIGREKGAHKIPALEQEALTMASFLSDPLASLPFWDR